MTYNASERGKHDHTCMKHQVLLGCSPCTVLTLKFVTVCTDKKAHAKARIPDRFLTTFSVEISMLIY